MSAALLGRRTTVRLKMMSSTLLGITGFRLRKTLAGLLLLTLCACSSTPELPKLIDSQRVYPISQEESGLLARYAPVLRIEQGERDYNKIGTVTAYEDNGQERIEIDTSQATLYTEQSEFKGRHGHYTNLIYRLHFSRVPFRAWPFSLTYGRNVGLFIIVTLNEAKQPVLLTTVHSCGCYLAFIPTDHLIESAYPANWPQQQTVFGERLPGRLALKSDPGKRILIDIKDGSHRIHGISVINDANLPSDRSIHALRLAPISALRSLPLGEKTTSMFEQSGPRKGYVKGSYKPFEGLLMGWWALDALVGVDKDYGDPAKTGTIFYTSLKPWNRQASNMWPFTDFLEFWGWSL